MENSEETPLESKPRYDLTLTHVYGVSNSTANGKVWLHIFIRCLLIGQIMTLCDITMIGDSDWSIYGVMLSQYKHQRKFVMMSQ